MMKTLIFTTLLLTLTSCGGGKDLAKTTIKIKLPDTGKFSSNSKLRSGRTNPADGVPWQPQSTYDLDCFLVFIHYSPDNGACVNFTSTDQDFASTEKLFYVTEAAGPFKGGANSEISLEVEAGDNRKFILVGFAINDNQCPNSVSNLTDNMHIIASRPYLLGSTAASFKGGENVSITIDAEFDQDKGFNYCQGSMFNWQRPTFNGDGAKFDDPDSLFNDPNTFFAP